MILVDSDVFLIDLRYRRDQRFGDNRAFLDRLAISNTGCSSESGSSAAAGASGSLGPRRASPRRSGRPVCARPCRTRIQRIADRALFIGDPDHSDDEDRFVLIGMSLALRTLVVCNCYREDDEIRMISARKASRLERAEYERRWAR